MSHLSTPFTSKGKQHESIQYLLFFFYFGCICIAFLYLVTMADRKLAFYGAFHYLPPCLVRFKLNVLTEKTGLNNNWRGTLNHQCTIYLTFQLWKYIHLKFYCKDH